jgi:uncharacterized membrane protein YdjX (TVP38/TMEM64 family)
MDGLESGIFELSEQSKVLAGFVYLLIVIVEVVVAPIPGAILYAPGGAIFGTFWGGSLALAGNVLGAGIACAITRAISKRATKNTESREEDHTETSRINTKSEDKPPCISSHETSRTKTKSEDKTGWFRSLLNSQAFGKLKNSIDKHGGWLIFFVRLNPLTSSDIISYAAGFCTIPIWRVMLATFFGMLPLCFVQAWASKSLLEAFPNLLIPLIVACGLYLLIAIYLIRRANNSSS